MQNNAHEKEQLRIAHPRSHADPTNRCPTTVSEFIISVGLRVLRMSLTTSVAVRLWCHFDGLFCLGAEFVQ